jgi:hypothetical protein
VRGADGIGSSALHVHPDQAQRSASNLHFRHGHERTGRSVEGRGHDRVVGFVVDDVERNLARPPSA